MRGNNSLLWEHHKFMDTVFGIICQGITPYSGNNTGVWIMYLGLYDRVSLPTFGNNTGVWIMYLGLYERESFSTLGTPQVYGYSIWDYMPRNHSLLWEQHRCLDNVFGIIWQGITPYFWEQHNCLDNVFGIIWPGITPYSWEQHNCLDNVFGTILQGITPYSWL